MPNVYLDRLGASIERTGASLCIGLDTDPSKLPDRYVDQPNPVLAFNREVIDATADLAASYKLNLAFYESSGSLGYEALRGTLRAIPKDTITVGDAKRGDIANTAAHYARALFEDLGFDAATVNPYLGMDSLEPFFAYPDIGIFVLALTSNPGSADFQRLVVDGDPLYRRVIDTTLVHFRDHGGAGFVVGATHPDELAAIRQRVGGSVPLLIPGLGSQGGDAEAIVSANAGGTALINVSRSIVHAGGVNAIRDAAESYHHGLRDAVARL